MTITEDIVREAFLPFALPAIGEDEIAEVVDTLRSGWVTTRPKVKLFEDRFAEYTKASNAKRISGVVTMPDGKALETDSSEASSVIARTAGALGPEASVPIGAAGGLGIAGAAATVSGIGAAVVGVGAAISNGRGSDLSPDKP